jgi:hypothetical protein
MINVDETSHAAGERLKALDLGLKLRTELMEGER